MIFIRRNPYGFPYFCEEIHRNEVLEGHIRINMEYGGMCLIDWGIFFFFVQKEKREFVGSVENEKSPLRKRGSGLLFK